MVFAFAGDSTTTSDLAIVFLATYEVRPAASAYRPPGNFTSSPRISHSVNRGSNFDPAIPNAADISSRPYASPGVKFARNGSVFSGLEEILWPAASPARTARPSTPSFPRLRAGH